MRSRAHKNTQVKESSTWPLQRKEVTGGAQKRECFSSRPAVTLHTHGEPLLHRPRRGRQTKAVRGAFCLRLSLAQHTCLLFRSLYCQCQTHALLVLLSRATHVLLFCSLCCQSHVHTQSVLLSGATHLLTVSLSMLSVSHTFIVGSALWRNTPAYCFALYAVSVTHMPCWFY